MTGDAGTTDATEHKQQAKVLTVSDGVMAGVRKDSSGAGLVSHLEAAGFEVIEHRTISDGVDNVSNTLSYMALNFVGLIATHQAHTVRQKLAPDSFWISGGNVYKRH